MSEWASGFSYVACLCLQFATTNQHHIIGYGDIDFCGGACNYHVMDELHIKSFNLASTYLPRVQLSEIVVVGRHHFVLFYLSKSCTYSYFYTIDIRILDVFNSCMLTFKPNVLALYRSSLIVGRNLYEGNCLVSIQMYIHALSPVGKMNSILRS